MESAGSSKGITIYQAALQMIGEIDSKTFTKDLVEILIPEPLRSEIITRETATELLVRVGYLAQDAIDRFAAYLGMGDYRTNEEAAATISMFLLPPAGTSIRIGDGEVVRLKRHVIFFIALLQMISALKGVRLRSEVADLQNRCNSIPEINNTGWKIALEKLDPPGSKQRKPRRKERR